MLVPDDPPISYDDDDDADDNDGDVDDDVDERCSTVHYSTAGHQ